RGGSRPPGSAGCRPRRCGRGGRRAPQRGECPSRPSPAWATLRDRASFAGDGLEGVGIVDGEVGERLAIEADAGLGQSADELRVRDADRAGRRVDADDPQAAEVTLPLAAVPIHEGPGVVDGLAGGLVAVAPLAAVPLGPLQDPVATTPCFETLLCARHWPWLQLPKASGEATARAPSAQANSFRLFATWSTEAWP